MLHDWFRTHQRRKQQGTAMKTREKTLVAGMVHAHSKKRKTTTPTSSQACSSYTVTGREPYCLPRLHTQPPATTAPILGLAILEPLGGLDVPLGWVDVEGALGAILVVLGGISTEGLVLWVELSSK